jgi:hypothetical protein
MAVIIPTYFVFTCTRMVQLLSYKFNIQMPPVSFLIIPTVLENKNNSENQNPKTVA